MHTFLFLYPASATEKHTHISDSNNLQGPQTLFIDMRMMGRGGVVKWSNPPMSV